MASLKNHNGFGFWFLIIALTFPQCKKVFPTELSPTKHITDYSSFYGSVSDIDGNTYRTFGIGTQIWMSENLRTSRLNNGKKINMVADKDQWKSLDQPGYCWYNNDSIKNEKFGALYNLYTVATGSVCPSGWHVPTQSDWNLLIKSFGGDKDAGELMKSYYNRFWNPSNDYGTRPTFLAIPSGFRNSLLDRQFTNIDTAGYWWTFITKSDSGYYSIFLKAISPAIHSSYFNKNDGLSIRCIRD